MTKFAGKQQKKGELRINRRIRAAQVRLVDGEGNQVGVLPVPDALKAAEEAGLDLVEVSPDADPPVCRLMDYGKYKYQMSKKAHEAKKKQAVVHVKEIKLRTRTDEHDFQFKVRNIKSFLSDGDKVKVGIFFRGREIMHPKIGEKMLLRVVDETKDVAAVDQNPRLEGRNMTILLGPLSSK
ncbi:MAG: translation initiation factor IF-3 [Deltaproteobacteria bacterium]|nr:translation initiation factor IF-3 [Deltaproteobacteria bacterium]